MKNLFKGIALTIMGLTIVQSLWMLFDHTIVTKYAWNLGQMFTLIFFVVMAGIVAYVLIKYW